jgi:hypothetical protein
MAKVRSPNYPAMDLGEALEAIRPAWKAEHRNKMSRTVLAKHLGYTSLNGRALGKIGAVRAYGLIDGSGEELRVSDDAVIALTSPDKVGFQYKDAMLRLATKSQLFQDLRKANPAELPSEDNLRFQLIQRGFTEEAAGKAAKTFLTTMRLVFDESGTYNPAGEPEGFEMQPDNRNAAHKDTFGHLGPMPEHLTRPVQEKFILDEGEVTLIFPQRLSVASYQDLEDRLTLVLRGAKRRAEARERLRTALGDNDEEAAN